MKLNWGKALGFGILLWVLMFVIISVFVAFNIAEGTLISIIFAIIGGIISFILAGKVKPSSAGAAFVYGLVWVIVVFILDWLISTRFNNAIFSAWTLWLGYALVLLAPLLKVKKA